MVDDPGSAMHNFGKQIKDYELHRLGMKLKLIYSLLGLFLGLSCIISGSILSVYGVTGHTSIIASFLGLSTQLNDAAPGVVIFIVGIFMVLITKFQVKGRTIINHETDIPKQPSLTRMSLMSDIQYSYFPPHRVFEKEKDKAQIVSSKKIIFKKLFSDD